MRLVLLFLNPLPVLKNIYYALTIQHTEFSASPIPLAEMISSVHSTAEISHFLNKWCLSVKTSTTWSQKLRKLRSILVGL